MKSILVKTKTRLLNRWDEVRNSYWFLPTLLAICSVLLSIVTLEIDRRLVEADITWRTGFYTGSAEGARSVLATIASSMIGIAGVVFSITTVTLTLASNRFGPRILRNFVSDTGNQIVLGTFTSTFLYCLLVLRQVHGSDDDGAYDSFIPQVSMFVAVVFAIASLGVLIYFIHHVAASIQTSNVVAAIGHEFRRGINDLFPEDVGEPTDDDDGDQLRLQLPNRFLDESAGMAVRTGGYLRRIEANELLSIATDKDLVIQVERTAGMFVSDGDIIFRVWPGPRLTEDLRNTLQGIYVVGQQRTPVQDASYSLGQLVEIAVMALSPGINDPFTAIMCIDWLADGLRMFARRKIPSPYRADEQGKLRVIAQPATFPRLLSEAFDQIRHNGRTHPTVMARLLEVLSGLASRACRRQDLDAILRQAEMVRDLAVASAPSDLDREKLEQRYQDVVMAAEQARIRQ